MGDAMREAMARAGWLETGEATVQTEDRHDEAP